MTSTEPLTPPTLPPELTAEMAAAKSAIDPYPLYRRVQQEFPVVHYRRAVNVFRYHDVTTVLRHPAIGVDDRRSTLYQSLRAEDRCAPDYLSQMDDQSFLHRDPPEHTRLRKLVASAFTARRVSALGSFAQRTVDEAITAAGRTGSLEVVGDLAYPLPIAVVCELLGVPDEDRPFVASWPRIQLCCAFEAGSLSAAKKIARDSTLRQVEADRLAHQLSSYFDVLIRRRTSEPGDDLISALLTAEVQGERLSTVEVNSTLRLLFVAGYENAVNLIGHGVLALLRDQEQWTALRDDPGLAAQTVDEVLRYDAPFQFVHRVALADLDVGGYRIRQGEHVRAWLAAANRDPAEFTAPDQFDIRRQDRHHLAFGTGIHACLGGPLARMEAQIVFSTLARRLVEPNLTNERPTYRTDVFRSLAELPIEIRGLRRAA